MQGQLIAFAGIDGSGKTTQAKILTDWLIDRGFDVVYLSSSGGVRRIFEGVPDIWERIDKMHDTSKSLFWASLYREYCNTAIQLYNEGKIVILDRWDESFLAYNLFFGEMRRDPELVRRLSNVIFQGITPTITFFADATPEICLERLRIREGGAETESLEELKINSQFFRDLAHQRGWIVINGDKEIQEIASEIKKKYYALTEIKIK